MKAVILAAGKGTRMGELTAHVPKPMKEVDGKPILQHIVEGLRDTAGVRDFFIVIGWCGHVITNHFGNGSAYGVRVAYGEQVVQDGTGKAPELAKDWIGSDKFLLMYGDILLRPPDDFKRLAEAFQEDGVIALKKVSDEELSKGGAVVLNEAGFMIDLIEKAPVGTAPKNAFYNAGIYLLTPRVFDYTAKLEKSPRNEYEFTDALKALFRSGAQVRGVTLQGDFSKRGVTSTMRGLSR